jgi:hypothetical protein
MESKLSITKLTLGEGFVLGFDSSVVDDAAANSVVSVVATEGAVAPGPGEPVALGSVTTIFLTVVGPVVVAVVFVSSVSVLTSKSDDFWGIASVFKNFM